MATFPTAVSSQSPQQAAPSQGGASPVIKLTMLGQLIQGLAKEFPQGQAGIEMMMKGLQMIQSSASAASAPPQPAAPPR